MGVTVLLNNENAPPKRLAVARIELDAQSPFVTLGDTGEGLLYALTGKCTVYADGMCIGTLGGRQKIEERDVQCIRFKAQPVITVGVVGHAADLLWVTCAGESTGWHGASYHVQREDVVVWHDVGSGTHQRVVAEVPTPQGYEIHCGETHNQVGGISSFPAHATQEDIARFSNGETTWEEVMFFECAKPGIANLKGVYTDGKIVNKLVEVFNGSAHALCLGSHAIYAAPDATIEYQWFYIGNALTKSYNAKATDLKTYVK